MEHIGIDNTNCKLALLVGDPSRVDFICNYFGENKNLTTKRGFLISKTIINNVEILIVSTGIGCPSLAIVLEELIAIGIKTFIRIGTCGGLQVNLEPGSIILSTGAVRDEGTSKQYIETNYPAIPNDELTFHISQHLKKYTRVFEKGITHSKDSFYSEKLELQLSPNETKYRWLKLKKANVLATDMETSCLFIISTLRKRKSASILVCVGEDKSDSKILHAFQFILSCLTDIINDCEHIISSSTTDNTKIDYSNSYLDKLK